MGIEQKINQKLNGHPIIKRKIKRSYQKLMYFFSEKKRLEGNIIKISPADSEHEYFFGYYDKSPWDITDRYVLCMRAKDTWSDVSPKEKADILLIDTDKEENNPERVKKIAETRAWNVQQSCMLQWLGPDFSSRILFNDYRNGQYCSVILTLSTMEEKVIPAAVYTVSNDGKFALTLDFSRLYNLRPGYGYYNVPEKTKGIGLPDETALWKVDLESGKVSDLLTYKDFSDFQPRIEMQKEGTIHKINHLMLSPNGKRFMVLYRWFNGQKKYTRLITCNIDGSDMYLLSDDDMVSHCFWKTNTSILAFENKKKTGAGYYLMKDKTNKYVHCWPQFVNDGHPSYSPDRSLVVTDTYPNRVRMASINLMAGEEKKNEYVTIAKVFAPFKYDNDTRCDLHPRWNHKGNKVCFDSAFEGSRGLYYVDITNNFLYTSKYNENSQEEKIKDFPLLSVIVPVYNVETYLSRCIESILAQTYKNLEIILVNDGSTDNSGAICEKFASMDSRIKLINKMNAGVSSARNAGIKVAKGAYITFVDGDDWIAKDIYEKSVLTMKRFNCDVVDFQVSFVNNNKIYNNNANFPPIVVQGRDILYDYLYRGQTEKAPFVVWRKVYKIDAFTKITFPEGKQNEDIITNYKVLKRCHKLVHISENGYFYNKNNAQSITSGMLKKKDFDILDVTKEMRELAKDTNDSRIEYLAEIKFARSFFSLLSKASIGGIADDVSKKDIRYLTSNLRKYYLRLMKSPMSLNRKMFVTLCSIDYHCISMPFTLLKKIKGKKKSIMP